MAIEQINPAVLATQLESLVESNAKGLDELERRFLEAVTVRLRRQGEGIWAWMSPREREYLQGVLLSAYRRGLFDGESLLGQELGLMSSADNERRRALLQRFEQRRLEVRQVLDEKGVTAPPLRLLPSEDEEQDRRLGPREHFVYQTKRYLLAQLHRDSFSAQNAWRKMERTGLAISERTRAYLTVLAVNEVLAEVNEHLTDPMDIISDPERSEDERVREFLSYTRGMAKLAEQQVRLLSEALDRLPDPDNRSRRGMG